MKRLATALPILGLVLATAAQAAPLYDNLSQTEVGYVGVDPSGAAGPLGDSFSTGDIAYAFNDLQLELGTLNETDGFLIAVNLFANDAGSNTPSSLIRNLGVVPDSSLSASPTIVDLTFATAVLAANTRYWIELETAAGGSGLWFFENDASGVGTAGEYSYSHLGGSSLNAAGNGPFIMSVGNTTVPEPLTLSLFGAGLIGAVALRRRKVRPGK